jgi:hypothetical protein
MEVEARKCKTREGTGMQGMGRQGNATEGKRMHMNEGSTEATIT